MKTRELKFLFDQKGSRLLAIGEVDVKVTSRLKVMQKQKEKVEKFLQQKQDKDKE